ncbi:hypothetical protein PQX77_012543, partial [Marasmius sp. AFHP31]
FNAVVDSTMSGGSNIYHPKYDKPAGGQFNSDSQVEAIAALLGGLTVRENNASTEPLGVSNASAESEPRSRSLPIGAIVGGVIGVIALAGLGAAFLLVYRCRVCAKSRDHETAAQWEAPVPFLDKTPSPTGKHPPPPPETSTILGRSDASSDSEVAGTLECLVTAIEELVSALNQRLGSGRRWDPNELPPEYSTQIERSDTLESGKRATG